MVVLFNEFVRKVGLKFGIIPSGVVWLLSKCKKPYVLAHECMHVCISLSLVRLLPLRGSGQHFLSNTLHYIYMHASQKDQHKLELIIVMLH